jgi:acetylornithine deacetylase/succinyl-diaminopimelate desuccinylase-like protein
MTDPVEEVVGLCRDLIRIDTTNTGDLATCVGERAAAEHVAGLLDEVGLVPEIRESAPGRASVVARFEGSDPSRGALLVHGHLDVVPADPD